MFKILAITGAPRGGKTTLAHRLQAELNTMASFISTRDMINALRPKPEEKLLLSLGGMFPWEASLCGAIDRFVQNAAGEGLPVVIDGLPRHGGQVEWLNRWSRNSCVLIVDPPADIRVRRMGLIDRLAWTADRNRMMLWCGHQVHSVMNACVTGGVPFRYEYDPEVRDSVVLELVEWLKSTK